VETPAQRQWAGRRLPLRSNDRPGRRAIRCRAAAAAPRNAVLATAALLRLPPPPLADQAVLVPAALASMQQDALDIAWTWCSPPMRVDAAGLRRLLVVCRPPPRRDDHRSQVRVG